MDRYDLLQYINAYNLQPYAFDDESVDALSQLANEFEVPFQRNIEAEEQKQTGVLGQLFGGILEGAIPLPFDMAKDPVTSAQQISRSVGSLIGFVPGILGGPLAWAGKGALKLGAKGALATGAQKVGSLGKGISSIKSVPMRGADYLLGKEVGEGVIAKLGSAGATADRFMKGTTVAGDIAKASVHLGTASLISEVWEGPSAMFDSFVHGAVAGGAFGAIGNYQNLLQKATGSSGPVLQKLAENKLMEGTLKAMVGAGFQGGLAASHDAPTAVVIYESLLGGYFGATHPSVQVRTGREWFTRYSADPAKKQHEMLKDPSFESLDPQVKKVVEDLHFQDIGEMYNRHLQDTQNIDYFDRSSAAQLLRNQFKDKIYEEYSTKNNIERNKLTDKEKTEALKEEIEPTLQIMEIIREGNQISDEILRKSPKDLTGETKEVYKKLTEDEIAKIEKGEFEPIYNYLISRNDFFKTWTTEQNGKDVLRMEEQVEIQAELDRQPVVRKFINDVKPRIKDKDISDVEIADTVLKSFNKNYKKEDDKTQYQRRTTEKLLSEEPELAHRIIDRLSETYPNITREISEKVFDIHGNEVAGKALGNAVKWSKSKGALDTPPHEYAHVYIDMFESSSVVQAGIRQFGSKEALADFLGKDYVNKIQDQGLRSRAKEWVKQFWAEMKNYFGLLNDDKEITNILSRRFFRGKPSGTAELTTRSFAEQSLQRFNSVPEDMRSNIVKTTLKSFGAIKDTETLVLNDSFYKRLENAGIKKAEIDLIKHMAESEQMHRVKADVFKTQMMQYLFPIKIVRSETTAPGEIGVPMEARESVPTSFYKRLSVEGGTNYGEYRFEVPFEVLKSHPRFATENMAGWFRGDVSAKEEFAPTKTFRVLEMQSDLFQKGRKTGDYLPEGKSEKFVKISPDNPETLNWKVGDIVDRFGKKYKVAERKRVESMLDPQEPYIDRFTLEPVKLDTDHTAYLKSLQKNWHDYFARAIHQWAAEQGYEKVRWPSGETAARVEGHTVISERIKSDKARLKEATSELTRLKKKEKEEKAKIKGKLQKIASKFDSTLMSKTPMQINQPSNSEDPLVRILEKKYGVDINTLFTGNTEFKITNLKSFKEDSFLETKWYTPWLGSRALPYTRFLEGIEKGTYGIFIDNGKLRYTQYPNRYQFKELSKKEAFELYNHQEKKNIDARVMSVESQVRSILNAKNDLEKNIQRFKTEGLDKLAPIQNFYQNTMRKVLQKSRKKNLSLEKDEHGNYWFETDITGQDKMPIVQYQRIAKEPIDGYEKFKDDIYKKLDVEPTAKTDRELRQAYEQFRQNKNQRQYEFNLQTGTLKETVEYNSLGVRKPLYHPMLPHEQMYGYEGKSYVINETVVNGRSYNPLGKMFKKSPTGEWEYRYVMEKGDWNRLLLNIQKNDKDSYMWLSEKDKGKLIVRPLHPETRKTKVNKIFNKEELATLYRDRGEFYKLVGVETSSKEVKDQWKKYHEEMAISNKLYDPIGEFKNALELVKRSSVMSSKDYALDPAKFQDIAPDGIDVIMVNDSKSAKYLDKPETYKVQVKGKGKKFSEEKIYDSDVDGYVVLHTKLFNRIVESMGFDPSTSHIKPTIATKIDGRMFILKGGIHPSQQGFDNAMVNPNSMIVMTSAGKVHPGKEYIGKVDKNGAYRFYNENAKGGLDIQKNPERFKLPVEKLLVNFGVYGDSHAVDPVTIKRQFHSVLNGLNMGGKYKAGYDALMGEFRKSFDGEAEQNEMVRRMLSKPTMEIPKEFDISKIGHKEIVDIFNQSQSNSPLLKLLMKDIIKDYKNIKQSEEITETDLLAATSYINRLEKQLKDTGYNVIAVRYLDAGSENFNDAVLRYIKNKYLTPRWDYSASSWVAGVHGLFKHALEGKEIKKDHFMLGHSMGDMKHAKYGTLKEAWKEYQKIKDSKKKKDFKEEHLRIAIMRVPSPDVSGTRVLYFDGFAKKGTTPDYGTYMRQKDHFYIDGADVDGDKVFLYQNMPKEFLDAVKAKKDNLELNGIMKQNKAEEFNPEYDLSASNPAMKKYINSKASQYMPNALYRTGRSSFVGKDGMGQVVTAKEYLGIVFSDIMKKGGVINIPLFGRDKKQYAVLKGRMDPNDLTKMDGYFTHAVEASSRTADSSTYYDLIDPRQMQNKLLKKGMPNARLIAVKNGKETGKLLYDSVKKKPVELEYRMLRDSRDYGDLFTLKNAIYNGKDFAGRKYKLSEVQKFLKKAQGLDKTFQSSLAYLSANMGREGYQLKTDILRFMDYRTYNTLLESVNKATKNNPAIKEAIKRNTMLIRPDYGKYRSKRENVTDQELEQILKLNDATDLHSVLMVTKAEELLSKDMMAKGINRDEINRVTMDMALKAVEHKDALVKVRKLGSIHKKNVNVNQLSDVEKIIRDYKREIKDIANQYDMPSNRFTDFYEMYMLGSLYPQSKPSKQVEMENKAMLDTAREIQKRRKTSTKNLDYEISYLQEKVDNHKKHIDKTSQHRYPYESNEISNKNKKIFISSFGNTFNLMRGRKEILQEVAKEPAVQQIKERVKGSEEGPKTEQQKDQQLKEDINDYLQPQANLFDFKVEGKVQAPADVKKAARDIVDIFKQFGEHSQQHLSDMFVAMTNARDGVSYGIEKATFRDIKDFRNFLQDQLHAGAKDGKPSILTQFLFPRRIAEKQFIHDWQTAETIKGLPFRDIKGNYGWTDIRVPLGTMKGLQNSFRNVYNMQNSSINYGQEERDKHFWWRKDILDLPDGVAKAQELQDLAMKHYLQDAGQGMQLEYNQAQWQKSKKAYEKLSKKEFTIVRNNKRVQVSGKEMMDIVAESNASYLKGLYNKWVKSGLDFTLIDPDAELQLTANYDAFNKQSPLLKYNKTTGKSNVETLFKTLIDPITKGKQNFDRLIGKGGFTTELLYRLQYEYQLEKFIRENKPSNPKKFREDYRQTKSEIFEEADQVTKYIRSKTAFAGVGEVKDKYWPHMFHMDTVSGRKEAEAFMERKRNELQLSLQDQIAKEMGVLKETGFEYTLDERFPLTKEDRAYITSGEIIDFTQRGGGTKESRAREIIDRKTAELENMFEQTLGSALTADNGSGEHGARWLLGKYANKKEAVNDGFFSRPGSGRARGKEPMPGFSYDFKVIEAYQDQWINAFYKSATALASKKQIDLYEQANPLKDKKLTEEWSNIMKDYASDVMGYDGMYSRSELSLSKQQLANRRSIIKKYESGNEKVKRRIGEAGYNQAKEDLKIHNRIKNKIGDTVNNAFYYVGDKAVVNGLEKLSKKFWMGGSENAPKLPIWGELPKSPEARRKTLSRIINQIGNAEAKYSLITLLSHPKTAVGNLLGGSHNTISNAGLSNFVDASFNRKKLLATIFRGAKLKDGTPITTKDHLIRFAEENGAIESYMVTEGSLERNFQFKEAKAMWSELTNFRKKNPDKRLSIGEFRDLIKKYKVTEAAVQAGALAMRVSERKLRSDSFYAHYLNAYNSLRSVIPNLKYDNPYVLNMALKGVEATQFLYHSAFRPKYSRTALGKVLTRFHPFAWNSIRFRRLAYKRAKRYGFREGTQDFNRMRRLLTLDMFALAMANVFVSSIFDSTLPPPLSWMQDAADWMFGDEKERDRAFFSSWPHPAMAPLQIATPPVARFALTPINAMINGNWDRFADYYLWTFFPFGRLGRSVKKTFEVPEMWLEQMTGIPIHAYAREIDKE